MSEIRALRLLVHEQAARIDELEQEQMRTAEVLNALRTLALDTAHKAGDEDVSIVVTWPEAPRVEDGS
jgi:hypothetical protein